MTSSTKPEVHNTFHCRQRRTEPEPQLNMYRKKCREIWTSGYWAMRADTLINRETDRQTDKQTRWSQYFQGRRRVLLAGVQYRGFGGRKSPSGVQRQSPSKGSRGLYPPEADDVLWIIVIRVDIGERFKTFTIHTVMYGGGTLMSKILVGFMKILRHPCGGWEGFGLPYPWPATPQNTSHFYRRRGSNWTTNPYICLSHTTDELR